MRPRYGARPLTITSADTLLNTAKLSGPIRLCGWSVNDGVAQQGLTVDQSANAPAAGATIASISLGNGEYLVEWTLTLSGTPGAGDVNNVKLSIGATQLATSVNLGVAGNYPQEEVNASVTFGPLTLAWQAIGNAVAGSVYTIEANITPVGISTGTVFDGAQAIGFIGIPQGGTETQWFGDWGPQVRTKISVQATVGTIQGVLWYEVVNLKPETGDDWYRIGG